MKGREFMYKFLQRSSLIILGCFVLAAVASADAQMRVDSDRSLQADIHVATPKLNQVVFNASGEDFTGLYMEYAGLLLDKGKPALPVLTGMVMISQNQKPVLEIISSKFSEITLKKPVVPSRGAISRSVDPSTVPFETGAVYKKNAWFPADKDLVKMSKPFIFREARGVRVDVTPVQYNPVTGKLRVYRSIHAKIKYDGPGGENINRGRSELSKAFAPIYQKAFLNYASVPRRLSAVDENGRLIIIAADKLKPAAKALAGWKQKCGIRTLLVSVSEAGGASAENIKAFLQEQYDEAGFTNVILVGDAEQIPTNKGENEKADSDPVYVKLAGDDHVPDAIISRISAATPEKVAYQIAKIINYEQYPSQNDEADWYGRALGIASNEGSPPDYDRVEELRQALLASRFSEVDSAYDPKAPANNGGGYDGYPYPGGGYPGSFPGMPGMGHPHFPMQPMPYSVSAARDTAGRSSLKDKVFTAVNRGVSLINYMGHGSTTAWSTTDFNTGDCEKLENGLRLPVIISVACVNGNFVGKDSFCEAWMNAGNIENPRGAVAIFGSTTNQSWVPPIKVQAAIVSDFIVNDSFKTVGGLMTNGIIKGLEIYGIEPKGEGVKMMEQWHLFGDGTTMIRTRKPEKITLEVSSESISGESQAIVKVVGGDGKLVKDARVTCYTKDMSQMSSARSNSEGVARVNIGVEKGGEAYLSVVGADLIPVVDQKIIF
ncbi:MAG: hypothetical protein CVV41_17900 [Candidatus Riflebacteria bacterium HGW-Riflebacteria-1]|jgi:gingipain R|nr:MAG: hypothetical protein CVV41_17900 [Candidatus Riflebacteria bacterium HGW-Riflebacteria-1]